MYSTSTLSRLLAARCTTNRFRRSRHRSCVPASPCRLLAICFVDFPFALYDTSPRRLSHAARTAALSLVAVSRRDAARTAALSLVAVSLAVSVSVCLYVRGLLVPVAPQFARPYIVRAALSLSYRPAFSAFAFRSPSAHDFPVLHVNWIGFCFLLGGLKTRSKN